MRLPTKLKVFSSFWPKKMLQPFITPHTLQIYLYQNIFCSQVENEVKWTPLYGRCWDPRSYNELKKAQKEEFSAAFQKLYNRAKACMELIFNLKKRHVSSIFKKNQSQNFWTALCVWGYWNLCM